MRQKYIGIDIGTSSIKFAVVTNQLRSLLSFQKAYTYVTPRKGWSEIEPDQWIIIVMEGIKEILSQFPPQEIAGIGLTGQMHTTAFIDGKMQSIRPAIMWNDMRTKELIPQIKSELAQSKQTTSLAKIVSTGSPLANVLWMKQNEPESFAQLSHFLIAKDYIVMKLTGAISTDHCDASTTSMYDVEAERWSSAVQTLFGLSPSLFPPINASSQLVGRLTPAVQKELGISVAIPVTAGTGDNVAAALASGSFANEQPLLSLGTSGVVAVPNNRMKLKPVGKNVVVKIRPEDHQILTQGTVQSGANTNSWWLADILKTTDYQSEQKAISQGALGINKVIFFPHLKGEKILFANPSLRGAFVGLSLETTRAEIYQALLEGVGFGLKQLFAVMKNEAPPDYFTLVGGGAKSELWGQILANIFNCPMKQVKESQDAVYGAAILAILGVEGEFLAYGKSHVMIEPTEALVKRYEVSYQRYLKLVEAMLSYTKEVAP
ncbi:xylulose kinase [Vagococcus sp. BWB3-3]|uniref:Xylulose kinase n=1 Tax=Vagococcus allomyrinae TaxID=2794353 RepID=A0A940PG57_9ENTE|nr:FGGY family carbohydrate kinase [Vagococcus allomyrinae]MBP1042263.1 xylulose kinase [Vagococcus allomyrinae]